MPIKNPTPKSLRALELANKAARITADAQHLYGQIAGLLPLPSESSRRSPSPLITKEEAAIQNLIKETEESLRPSALKTQPKYTEKCLLYLQQQLEVYLAHSKSAGSQENPIEAWIHANQSLYAQVTGLVLEIEETERQLALNLASDD
jgi:hypothetical protein